MTQIDYYDIDSIINSDLSVRAMIANLTNLKNGIIYDTTVTQTEKDKIVRRCNLVIDNYTKNYL